MNPSITSEDWCLQSFSTLQNNHRNNMGSNYTMALQVHDENSEHRLNLNRTQSVKQCFTTSSSDQHPKIGKTNSVPVVHISNSPNRSIPFSPSKVRNYENVSPFAIGNGVS